MIIDYVNKSVTFTFEEMKVAQTQLVEALKYGRSEPKDIRTSIYCIRGAGESLHMTGMDRKDND